MLLRPFCSDDARQIVSWIKDELTLRRWSADRFGEHPISEADILVKYEESRKYVGDDRFVPLIAYDESGTIGHLVMRFLEEEEPTLRFGFVIVNDARRGKGYGKEMVRLSLRYAFDTLRANTVTIGVFENNPAALYCYKSVGFRETGEEYYEIMGEKWRCIELKISR